MGEKTESEAAEGGGGGGGGNSGESGGEDIAGSEGASLD